MMENPGLKEAYRNTFNAISAGYGHSAMRFFSEAPDEVSSLLNMRGDEHVIDVATGTGYVAFALARDLPDGHVTGIDFSEGMLAQAIENKNKLGIPNVTFVEMDMQAIDYKDNHFDVAVSSFSIFFVEDMAKQLIHVASKVKPGGAVLITTFSDNAFTPLVNVFLNRLAKYGIEVSSMAWKGVSTEKQCTTLFKTAGLQNIHCEQKECGYYLRDASDWWYIIWNGGFRGLVSQLSEKDFLQFKKEHMAEAADLASDKGIWLDMGVLYTSGEKGHSNTR
ncbi:class I SAM-dependent methyltransferase [Desulfoluna butyratoxydans]|uniref:S-adenosyl-l-methionine-dependent methyltransferase n=1 Tax=Desulfoluna butyratoxydans TaxID=231438 RepID=A0A4U8YLH0_9BACT|nr:class I SAM-dependent methyltransferase [Desulfoluna butyratoxydans]VFQ44796.1 s-adenosyl-l-methionine-dependent methyltransferase [Desulfoluna butyratoxydans]